MQIFFCGFFFFLATMLFVSTGWAVDSKLVGLLALSLDEDRVLRAGAMAEMKKGYLAKKKVERTCCCERKGLQLTDIPVMSAINLLMSTQDWDTTFDDETQHSKRAGLVGDHRAHLKCMFWIFMMYYAGFPYTGGQQSILQHLLGCKGDNKQPKTDISESCALFLEIFPLIRAIVAGFLGDTLNDYDFLLAAFAK